MVFAFSLILTLLFSIFSVSLFFVNSEFFIDLLMLLCLG